MSETSRNIALIVTLWVAGLLAGAQFAKVSVLLPEFRLLYAAHGEDIAWLLTLVSITGAILGGLAGNFAIRVGLKRFLVASLLAAGGLSFWQATYPPFAIMAVSRILEGVTHLGIVVTAPALMAQASSVKWRGATMALWSTFFGVSFAIFAWFGVPHVEELKVSGLFRIHGICLILIAGLVFCLLARPDGAGTERQAAQAPEASTLAAFRNLRVIWPGVGWLFYTLTFLALLTILPLQMPNDLRAQTTTAMSLVGIGTALLVVPVLLLRLKATTVVLIGFTLSGLVTALGSELGVLVFAISLFAALGTVQGGTFAAVAELNRSTAERTLGYGFMAQTGNLGNLIGTPFLLFALGTGGPKTLLLTTAAIYGVGLLCLTILDRRIRIADRTT